MDQYETAKESCMGLQVYIALKAGINRYFKESRASRPGVVNEGC